ncbi:Ser/Thr protein phosphatase superfamily protein [Gymnopilus junonius]|uniref:Ser/Thr protein phosphatase superfamily protein n=1 Tax=Gymnopilus junonius TaxID=109634 RepID=A0A9P5P2M1_GYMJU|nr:Ser/Thr protein phosphatase superfamily protein [Gymnopilus junonius]
MTSSSTSAAFPLQILSDLHIEIERSSEASLYTYDFPAIAPNIALLGDIGWSCDDRLFDWLRAQLERFERLFFLVGNHEPYGFGDDNTDASIARFSAFEKTVASDPSLGKFIFLNRTRYDISPTLTILGCTLWSHLNPDDKDILSWSLTDFKRIRSFTMDAYEELHQQDVTWLRETLASIRESEPERKVVVFTHHAPTVEGTGDPKYLGGLTNSAFATELATKESGIWGSPVVMWAFGHTHWSCDFIKEGIRVYSNQRGYKDGGPEYDPRKALDLSTL